MHVSPSTCSLPDSNHVSHRLSSSLLVFMLAIPVLQFVAPNGLALLSLRAYFQNAADSLGSTNPQSLPSYDHYFLTFSIAQDFFFALSLSPASLSLSVSPSLSENALWARTLLSFFTVTTIHDPMYYPTPPLPRASLPLDRMRYAIGHVS
ncbi:hypothetical protein K439DRAFT_329548 [Ramaria rubella]|nr:hypothetical protein K439DRAFT_329548 [Ramaria rubella]